MGGTQGRHADRRFVNQLGEGGGGVGIQEVAPTPLSSSPRHAAGLSNLGSNDALSSNSAASSVSSSSSSSSSFEKNRVSAHRDDYEADSRVRDDRKDVETDEKTLAVVDISDFDCPLCLQLLCEPIATACGHTFCRICLVTALQNSVKRCPSCRSPCDINAETKPCNILIQSLIRKSYPQQLKKRELEAKLEKEKWAARLSIFFLNILVFPGSPVHLHLFEPRYLTMLKRAMEGSREFGMMPSYHPRAGSVGCVVQITECEFTDEGTANISCVGRRRFRLNDFWVEEGTNGLVVANVEYFDDERKAPPTPAAPAPQPAQPSSPAVQPAQPSVVVAVAQPASDNSNSAPTANNAVATPSSNSSNSSSSSSSDNSNANTVTNTNVNTNAVVIEQKEQPAAVVVANSNSNSSESEWRRVMDEKHDSVINAILPLLEEFMTLLSAQDKQSLLEQHGPAPKPNEADKEKRGQKLSFWLTVILPFPLAKRMELLGSADLFGRLSACLSVMKQCMPVLRNRKKH